MIAWSPPERPTVLASSFVDGEVVDAREALAHESVRVELPVLVAVGPEPVTRVIVPFVGEAHGDPVVGDGPEFLDEPVIELLCPFALQEAHYLFAPGDEFRAVAPRAVGGVRERHALRIATVPAVFGSPHLLAGGIGREGR